MRIGLRGVLGILLSAALLWWALHDVSPAQVWQVLRSSNIALFVLSAGAATLSFPMRAWRWRYILRSVAPDVRFGPLWRATAIGMMANNVAPLRAGEVARAFVISREERRVSFTAALASLLIDRVFDMLVILLLLVAVIVQPAFPRGTMVLERPVGDWAIGLGAFAGAVLLALTVLAFFPGLALRMWDAVAGRVVPKLAPRGRVLLENFTSGLGVLRDPGRFLVVFAWALAQWLVNGASFWIAFKAVGIDAPFSAALFLQSLLAVAVSAPSAPGFFGVFETAARIALTVYGIAPTLAVSYAIGYHLLSFVPITVMGLWYFSRLGLHFRDFGKPEA